MTARAIHQGDLRERIVAALRGANKPVTFKGIAKLVKAKEEQCREALDSAVVANELYRWPDYRRSQYFWHLSPGEKAREAVLAVLSARAVSESDLCRQAAKRVPGFSGKQFNNVVSDLIAEKQLRAVPAFSSTSKLLVKAGDSNGYFNAVRSFVEKKIVAAGFDPADFFSGHSSLGKKPAVAREDAAALADALILEAVQSLEPVRGVPVSTLRLRNHLPNLPKHEFDAAALELRKRQEVFLSQHADPHNLSQEDQDLLIDGRDGTFYVAIALR